MISFWFYDLPAVGEGHKLIFYARLAAEKPVIDVVDAWCQDNLSDDCFVRLKGYYASYDRNDIMLLKLTWHNRNLDPEELL